MSYNVVIAEDFRMIRELFENTVNRAEDYNLAASFPTAMQAVRSIEKIDADLVLMDVLIPGSMNGLDAAEMIKSAKPNVKVIIVTSMPELSYEKRAREIGVEGFWQKEIQVAIGNTLSTDFTEKEIEVLRELVTGESNKEIAEKLSMGQSTVKMHITNMLQKSGYRSRLELALMARQYGIAISDRD